MGSTEVKENVVPFGDYHLRGQGSNHAARALLVIATIILAGAFTYFTSPDVHNYINNKVSDEPYFYGAMATLAGVALGLLGYVAYEHWTKNAPFSPASLVGE